MDWNQSAKNTFFSRYFLLNFNNPPLFDGKNGLTTTLAGQSVRSQSLVLGDNYSIRAVDRQYRPRHRDPPARQPVGGVEPLYARRRRRQDL